MEPKLSWSDYVKSLVNNDWKSGISVFLIGLPLCLGIALASGAPLYAGLISGIIGGVVASLLSESQLLVSAPAAGLTVIVSGAILQLQSFEAFLVCIVLAGCIQIVMGILKLGSLSAYFPESVIRGMLVAIGVVIVLKQIPHALGYDRNAEGEFEFVQLDHENTLTEIFQAISVPNLGAIIISILTILALVGWNRLAEEKTAFFNFVPSVLVAVLIGVVTNELFRIYAPNLYLGNSPGHMVNLPTNQASITQFLHTPNFRFLFNGQVWIIGVTLALVASLESLLTLEATDTTIDPQHLISSSNRELIAQGTGNILCGLLGGIPIAAAVIRTSTNIYTGARSRMSSFSGLTSARFGAIYSAYIKPYSIGSFGCNINFVGYRLAHPSKVRQQANGGIDQFVPFLITILLVVFFNLLTGIIGGTLVGIAFVLLANYRSEITVVRDGHLLLVKFNKDISFLSKARMKQVLHDIHRGDSVLFDGTKAAFVDYDVFQMMRLFKESVAGRGIKVTFKNVGRRKIGDRSEVEML